MSITVFEAKPEKQFFTDLSVVGLALRL